MATATITIVLPTARTDGTSFGPDEIDHTDIFDLTSPTPDVAIGTCKGRGDEFHDRCSQRRRSQLRLVVNDTTGHMSAASNVASVTVPAVLANPNPATITAVLNP